jgi:hypothetical protein
MHTVQLTENCILSVLILLAPSENLAIMFAQKEEGLYGIYHILEDLFLASFENLKLVSHVSLPSQKLASPPCC